MRRNGLRAALPRLSVATLASLLATSASAAPPGSHLWVIEEVFSNPSGSIQFVELLECCGASAEINLEGKDVSSATTGKSFLFPEDLTEDTANKSLLLATADFAALPGAPAPDYVLPDGFFDTQEDTLTWFVYAAATLTFEAGELPLDGVYSLNRDGTTGVNSPTNFAGQSGSVDLGAPSAPAVGPAGALGLVVLLLGGGVFLARRR